MATAPSFVATPKIAANTANSSDTAGTYKTLYTGGASGSKVVSVIATSTDATAHLVTLAYSNSTFNNILGAVSVPGNSGTNGSVATVDLLAGGTSAYLQGLPRDNDGQKYLFLKSGDLLTYTFATAFTGSTTTTNTIYITMIGGDF